MEFERIVTSRRLLRARAPIFLLLCSVLSGTDWFAFSSTGESGESLFSRTCVWVMLFLFILMPLSACAAIVKERRQRVLEVILTTPASPVAYVLARIAAPMGAMAVLLYGLLPIAGISLILGGITITQIVLAAAVLLALAFVGASASVLSSIYAMQVPGAALGSYILTILLPGVAWLLESDPGFAALLQGGSSADSSVVSFITGMAPQTLLFKVSTASGYGVFFKASDFAWGFCSLVALGLTYAFGAALALRRLAATTGSTSAIRPSRRTHPLVIFPSTVLFLLIDKLLSRKRRQVAMAASVPLRGSRPENLPSENHLWLSQISWRKLLAHRPIAWLEILRSGDSTRRLTKILGFTVFLILEGALLAQALMAPMIARTIWFQTGACLLCMAIAIFLAALRSITSIRSETDPAFLDVLHSTPMTNAEWLEAKFLSAISSAAPWWMLANIHAALACFAAEIPWWTLPIFLLNSALWLVPCTVVGLRAAIEQRTLGSGLILCLRKAALSHIVFGFVGGVLIGWIFSAPLESWMVLPFATIRWPLRLVAMDLSTQVFVALVCVLPLVLDIAFALRSLAIRVPALYSFHRDQRRLPNERIRSPKHMAPVLESRKRFSSEAQGRKS